MPRNWGRRVFPWHSTINCRSKRKNRNEDGYKWNNQKQHIFIKHVFGWSQTFEKSRQNKALPLGQCLKNTTVNCLTCNFYRRCRWKSWLCVADQSPLVVQKCTSCVFGTGVKKAETVFQTSHDCILCSVIPYLICSSILSVRTIYDAVTSNRYYLLPPSPSTLLLRAEQWPTGPFFNLRMISLP